MNLETAIEILSSNGLCPEQTAWGDYLEAAKLGREAMKTIVAWRNIADNVDLMHLPGETED